MNKLLLIITKDSIIAKLKALGVKEREFQFTYERNGELNKRAYEHEYRRRPNTGKVVTR